MLHIFWCFLCVDAIELALNSSERYACLGKTYKLNCTSTKAFNECGVSLPNWYKDGNIIACTNGCSNRKAYDNKIEEISVQIPHSFQNDSVYYCASGNKRRQPKCLSNDFPVQPLRKLGTQNTIQSILMHTVHAIAAIILCGMLKCT